MLRTRAQSSTSYPINFLLVLSTDHLTGATGKTVTVTLSKNGAAFGAALGAVTEISSGWYSLAGNATDRATLGELLIHATATGCDPVDIPSNIITVDLFASNLGIASVTLAADQAVNATKFGGTTVTGRDLGASVLLSSGAGAGQLDFTSGVVKANATQWLSGTIPAVNVTGVPKVDVVDLLGTAVSTPATAGILDVNAKNINNVATTSVTTISANQGTTQPVNFTGTGASALAKSDMVDVAGSAVSTSSAQLGVNAVNVGGTAQTGRDLGANIDTTVSSRLASASLVSASGTASAGAASSITLAGASATDSAYTGETVLITGGTGAGQARIITAYVGSTKVATVSPAWATTPDNTSVFVVLALGRVNLDAWLLSAPNALSSSRVDVSVGAYQSGLTPLQPTTSGRTLDVSATGEAGLDWANVGSPTTTLDLSGTTVKNVDNAIANVTTVANLTTNNDKTGYALTSGEHTSIASDAQTGLTSQGYTTTRAPYLDIINKLQVVTGTASAGGATSITLAGASATDSLYVGEAVLIVSGTGAGQIRVITAYVGSTKVATISPAWSVNPDNTSVYAVLAMGRVTADVVNDKTGYALTSGEHTNIATDAQTGLTAQGYTTARAGYLDTLNGLVQAVWDKATSALTTAGSIGKLIVDNINATISSRLPTASYTAPDNTTIATINASLGAITGSGVNTVLGFFKALLNKSASAPSDIGGTFDPSTDSTEAIRDTAPLGTAMRGTDSALLASSYTAPDNADIATILTDTTNIKTRLPAALSSGRMDSSVGAYQSGQAPLQPTTTGRTLDVSATGEAGVDWANVGSPTTTLDLSGTTVKNVDNAIALVTAVTNDVGITQAGADKVWSTTARALTDKIGFALSVAGIQAIFDTLTSALTTAGSIGKLLVDNLNATVASRLSAASYTAPLSSGQTASAVLDAVAASYNTAGSIGNKINTGGSGGAPTLSQIVNGVWDEQLDLHPDAGSAGYALSAAGSAGDPWSTSLPGAYPAGTAGYDLSLVPSIDGRIVVPGAAFVSPIAQDGVTTTLYVSRDYLITNAQALDYPIPNLDPADVITWSVTRSGQAPLTKAGTYVASSPNPIARIQPTAADTLTLSGSLGNQHLEILITNAAGNKAEKVVGTCFVKGVNVP